MDFYKELEKIDRYVPIREEQEIEKYNRLINKIKNRKIINI